MKDETIAVVAGRDPKAHYGAVNTPVYRASTILFETFEEFAAGLHDPARRKYMYGRIGTPTSASLEDAAPANRKSAVAATAGVRRMPGMMGLPVKFRSFGRSFGLAIPSRLARSHSHS